MVNFSFQCDWIKEFWEYLKTQKGVMHGVVLRVFPEEISL
jgi:hypothetical protein